MFHHPVYASNIINMSLFGCHVVKMFHLPEYASNIINMSLFGCHVVNMFHHPEYASNIINMSLFGCHVVNMFHHPVYASNIINMSLFGCHVVNMFHHAVKSCTHIEDIQMKKRTEAFLLLLHNTFLIIVCVKNTTKIRQNFRFCWIKKSECLKKFPSVRF